MPDGSASTFKVQPQYISPPPQQAAAQSSTYVYSPAHRFVGTGGMQLKPQKGSPDFKGYIIFVNGNIGNPQHNTAGVVNSLRDKIPEETHTGNRGQNVNEGQDGKPNYEADPEDRYSQKQADIDQANEKSFSYNAKKALLEAISPRLLLKDTLNSNFSFTKYQRFVGYWNQESNNYKFTVNYADYFDAKGNEHYINGSHGLQSKAPHRMRHGTVQGYAWAKANLPTITKTDYERFKQFAPWIPQPKDAPITVVMHSQGNAMGLGVVRGIGQYMFEKGWDQIALNLVMLSVHQNMSLKGKEYQDYKNEKIDMLAPDYLLNNLPGVYSHDKLVTQQGIEEYAHDYFVNWSSVKKHGVQFTFANDRLDVVTRMGDLPGMESACGPDTKKDIMPFHIKENGPVINEFFLNNLFTVNSFKNGKLTIDRHEKSKYKDLVATLFKKYTEYKKQKIYFETHQRFIPTYSEAGAYDGLKIYYDALVSAYGDLWNAELSVHGAPVAWGFQAQMLDSWAENKTIFQLIKEHGNNIFYRKANMAVALIPVNHIYNK